MVFRTLTIPALCRLQKVIPFTTVLLIFVIMSAGCRSGRPTREISADLSVLISLRQRPAPVQNHVTRKSVIPHTNFSVHHVVMSNKQPLDISAQAPVAASESRNLEPVPSMKFPGKGNTKTLSSSQEKAVLIKTARNTRGSNPPYRILISAVSANTAVDSREITFAVPGVNGSRFQPPIKQRLFQLLSSSRAAAIADSAAVDSRHFPSAASTGSTPSPAHEPLSTHSILSVSDDTRSVAGASKPGISGAIFQGRTPDAPAQAEMDAHKDPHTTEPAALSIANDSQSTQEPELGPSPILQAKRMWRLDLQDKPARAPMDPVAPGAEKRAPAPEQIVASTSLGNKAPQLRQQIAEAPLAHTAVKHNMAKAPAASLAPPVAGTAVVPSSQTPILKNYYVDVNSKRIAEKPAANTTANMPTFAQAISKEASQPKSTGILITQAGFKADTTRTPAPAKQEAHAQAGNQTTPPAAKTPCPTPSSLKSADAISQSAITQAQSGDFACAETLFFHLQRSRVLNGPEKRYYAKTLVATGKIEKAMQVYQWYTQTNPEDDEASLEYAGLLLDQNKTREVFIILATVLNDTHCSPELISRIQGLLDVMAHQSRAVDRDYINTRLLLGHRFMEGGRYSAARKQFQAILDVAPQSPQALISVAETHVKEMDKSKALAIYNDIAGVFPNNYWIQRRHCEILAWNENYKEAFRVASRLSDSAPADLFIQNHLMALYIATGNSEGARQHIAQLQQTHPDVAASLDARMNVLLSQQVRDDQMQTAWFKPENFEDIIAVVSRDITK